jgi:hypothetical protein
MKKSKNKGIAKFVKAQLPTFVQAIAYAQQGGGSGADKLDSASRWLADKVDIPLLPEYLERELFKVALSVVVELAKSTWGDREWFEKLTAIFGIDT